ncbi:AlwI restriction endonuclease [Fibrobacter sp. UWP2]|nr:AlwI restriction endonuclease [Fibrobacter sp. UWP2]
MLEDYLDLNRRYLGLTNCFIFNEKKVELDIVPKQLFNSAISELYKQAYKKSDLRFKRSSLEEICPALIFNEENIIKGINRDLGSNVNNIKAAYNEVDRLRYERFNKLIDSKFTDEKLLALLYKFELRSDDEICRMVTENADVPTIFEYILGIIWYKISEKKGKILDYFKLSLDANLLPVTHAGGGEADIVYEYDSTSNYPEHNLLLEATLADSTNQRRMEMEPVSRHLGNHLLRTNNINTYCVFVTTFLHINVIGDFRGRKNLIYCDPQNPDKWITGMKIIPLSTEDLKNIIEYNITYSYLYQYFADAHKSNEFHPQKWYDNCIKIKNAQIIKANSRMSMVAEKKPPKYR